MKNLIKSVAVIAVLFLSAGMVKGQQKIGHVNSGDIIQSMPEFRTANTELETLQKTKEGELQQMFAEFQKMQNDAQEKYRNRSEANKDSIDAQLQTLSIELQEIEGRINEVQRVAEEELRKKQDELITPIIQKANTAIQGVAKEKGYAYVFDVANNGIPYFEGGEDITEDVKTKLGIAGNTPVTPSTTTPTTPPAGQ